MLVILTNLFMVVLYISWLVPTFEVILRHPLYTKGKMLITMGFLIIVDIMQPPMKHVIDVTNSGEAGAVRRYIILAKGTLNPDPYTNVTDVKAGSIVPHIEVQFESIPEAKLYNTPYWISWYVWFNINASQTQPDPDLVGQSHLKNQVFHQEMALYPMIHEESLVGITADAAKVWRASLNIPKTWRQLNDGDQIELVYKIYNNGFNFTTKGRAIYKEIFP